MRRSRNLWVLAFLVTLIAAVYQRMSGPTYPAKGSVTLGGVSIPLELSRSHGGPGDQPVEVTAPDRAVRVEMIWRRFPSTQPWQTVELERHGEVLKTSLPHQPPAGKLEYQLGLTRGQERVVFPARPAVTRFKNEDPLPILIPHVLAMFLGMLWSTRAGLEAWARGGGERRLAWIAFALLATGGFVLGPLVQKAAFGQYWTGIPFGYDLTDNKTLIAGVAWVWALIRLRGRAPARWSVIAAALATLVVFAIPHSVWGSQINWETVHPSDTPF
jgi:hypothetical protein